VENNVVVNLVHLACVLLFLLSCTGCNVAPIDAAQISNNAHAASQPDAALAATYKSLRQIGTGDTRKGLPDTDVPEAAKTLLTQLKHGLRDLIADTLNNRDNRSATPLQLRSQVVNRLAQNNIKVVYPNDEEPPDEVYDPDKPEPEIKFLYGEVNRIKIQTPAQHLNLLAITTTVSVPYGSDTSLYLFRRANDSWQLVLAHEANGYKDITGAQAQFDYAVSPPNETGRFFIVAAHIPPWFVSCWSSLKYSVLRIGREPYAPQVLLQSKGSVFRCDEPPYTLDVRADKFKLSFHDHKWMDMLNNGIEVDENDDRSKTVVEYLIKGDDPIRIPHK
jgi:hypothetical protein